MKRYLILFFPFIPFFIFFSQFFFQLELPVNQEKKVYIYDQETSELKQKTENELEFRDWFFTKGIFYDFIFVRDLRDDFNNVWTGKGRYFEETLEKLERQFLSQVLIIFFYFFLLFLSFSSFWSLLKNAWFSTYLNKFLYFIFIVYILQNLAFLGTTLEVFPRLSTFLIVLNLFIFIYILFCFFYINRVVNPTSFAFKNLTYLRNQETSNIESISFLKTTLHFILILVFGLVVGNLVYIPFFSLQKNFSKEFGIIFFVLVFLLSVFYIKNYYFFAKETYYSKITNIALSFSFLQFRILKNITLSIFLIFLITVFFSILFLILFLNVDLLNKNFFILSEETYF